MTVSSATCVTESVPNEVKFNADIDDPKATPQSPAMQMISCAVNATTDFGQMNKEGLANYPRCIIQLINKKQDVSQALD